MTVKELYRQGLTALQGHGVPDADLDCGFYLSHLLGVPKNQLFLSDHPVTSIIQQRFAQFIQRRSAFEPLAYIIGEQEFWSLPFTVNPSVLIPRPETEILVEEVLAIIDHPQSYQGLVLDMGTGSGILPVTLATELPRAAFIGLDISRAALQVALANCQRHQVEERISLLQASWHSALQPGQFDIIVSNPPYVDPATFISLQDDVVDHEPHLALDGGKQGRAVIADFAPAVANYLKPGGWFFMEIGYDQQDYMLALLEAQPLFSNIAIRRDYADLPRIIKAQRCAPGEN